MGRVFDPYHKWLGIPPEDQPPSHYRLLGLRAFEADPDVIQAAADQRMAHLRNYQTGQHADLSQRLLNEVAAARVCLLNPVKRAAYDSQLRERMEASQPAAYDVQAATPSGGLLAGMLDELSDFPAPPIRPRPFLLSGYRRHRLLRRFAAGLAAVVLLMLLCSYWPGNNVSPPPPDAVATSTNRPAVENVKKAKRSDSAPPAKKAKQTAVRTEEKGSTEAAAPAPSSAAKLPGATATAPKKTSQAVLSLTPDNPPPLANPTAMTSAMSERNADAGHASEGRWPGKSLSEKPPRERVAVPGAAALDDAMKLACDLYKDEFAKAKTAREKQAFARKLFDQAMAASNADAGTFVLFQLARDIAVQAADAGTAFGAVDALAERYQIDAPAMKAEVLAAFAKKARTPQEHQVMAEQGERLMDEAAAAGNFPAAAELAKMAISEGELGHGKDLVARVKTCLPDFQNAAALVADFEAAKTKLSGAPEDPDANLTAGRYDCFIKGDWKTGLAHLAKGSDASLRVLAGRELNMAQANADDQVTLADGWWDVGQNEDGIVKLAVLRHARFWYAKADAILTGGLNKVKIGKRLDEIAKFEGEKSPAGASRSAVRIGKWFPLLGSPNDLAGWEAADCRYLYMNWIIEVHEDCLVCPIVAKDMAMRCLVSRSSGTACLIVRNSDEGCYTLALDDRKLRILYQRYSAEPGTSLRARRAPEVLNECLLPRSSANVRVLGFSVEGAMLTAFVDGQPVLRAADTALTEGTVGVGAIGPSKVYFSEIDLFIPNKVSFVVDRRTSLAPSKGAAGDFKLPPAKLIP